MPWTASMLVYVTLQVSHGEAEVLAPGLARQGAEDPAPSPAGWPRPGVPTEGQAPHLPWRCSLATGTTPQANALQWPRVSALSQSCRASLGPSSTSLARGGVPRFSQTRRRKGASGDEEQR